MFQLKSLIENLNSQTKIYRELEPVMKEMRKKEDKSPEEMMEILRNNQISIDAVSNLADEKRVIEKALSEKLNLEHFDRKSLAGLVPEDMLASLDNATADLEKILKAVIVCQRGTIEDIRTEKMEISSLLAETAKGKKKARTYYVKDRDACFIDKRSK